VTQRPGNAQLSLLDCRFHNVASGIVFTAKGAARAWKQTVSDALGSLASGAGPKAALGPSTEAT
jgi:hypothetical protein